MNDNADSRDFEWETKVKVPLACFVFLTLHLQAGEAISPTAGTTFELAGRWLSPKGDPLIVEVDKVQDQIRSAKVFICTPTLIDEPATQEFFDSGPGNLDTRIRTVIWDKATNSCLISTSDCNGHQAWSSPLFLVDLNRNLVLSVDAVIGDVTDEPMMNDSGLIEVPIQAYDKASNETKDSVVKTSFKDLFDRFNRAAAAK